MVHRMNVAGWLVAAACVAGFAAYAWALFTAPLVVLTWTALAVVGASLALVCAIGVSAGLARWDP
jgi:hypothetical protein